MKNLKAKIMVVLFLMAIIALGLPIGGSDTALGQSIPTRTPTPDPRPSITSFTPTSGPAGTVVTINGTNLWNASAVRFNGVLARSFVVSSSTKITAVVRNGTTTGKITVTAPRGTATSIDDFVVTVPAPTITSFSPTTGAAGTSVVINGTNFTGATSVRFNGLATASFTVNSATRITAVVPAGVTSGPVSVTTPGGTATSSTSFLVGVGKPVVSGFSPASAARGATIVINGSNFTGATRVTFFDGKGATPTVLSDSQLQVVVPAGATTGKVRVTNPAGTGISAGNFTVLLPPAVTGFTPTGGVPGTTVTVTGRHFVVGDTTVKFGSVTATGVTVLSATKLTVNVPTMAAGSVRISVTTPAGTGTSSTNFRVR